MYYIKKDGSEDIFIFLHITLEQKHIVSINLQSGPNSFGRRSTRTHKMLQFMFTPSAIHAPIPPINVEMKGECQNCFSHIHIQHWEGGGGGVNQNIDHI